MTSTAPIYKEWNVFANNERYWLPYVNLLAILLGDGILHATVGLGRWWGL